MAQERPSQLDIIQTQNSAHDSMSTTKINISSRSDHEKDKELKQVNKIHKTINNKAPKGAKTKCSLRNRLTRKIALLSSLDSFNKTDNSSSEMGTSQSGEISGQQGKCSEDYLASPMMINRRIKNRNPLIRNPNRIDQDDELEDEEDARLFNENEPAFAVNAYNLNAHLSISRQQQNQQQQQTTTFVHRERPHQQQEPPMDNYEDLLDDRQGMNSGEQQQLTPTIISKPFDARILGFSSSNNNNNVNPSGHFNASIMNDFVHIAMDNRDAHRSSHPSSIGNQHAAKQKATGLVKFKSRSNNNNSGHKLSGKHRGKSPKRASSSIGSGKRSGLFGLVSRLKLTRRHKSIAKLQLSILQSGLIVLKRLDVPDFQTFLPRERITPNDLAKRVKLFRRYPILASIEYSFANRYEQYTCKQAQHVANAPKNTYPQRVPYDYNRVVLKTLPNKEQSDYINASHVNSYLKPNAYIAAMGPNEETVDDFWRMVWEQKSFVIVMLTKVFDFIKVMCNQYWPVELKKPERHGNLMVTLLYEEPLADFVIRTIKLTKCKPEQAQKKPAMTNSNGAGDHQQCQLATNSKSSQLNIVAEEDDYDDEGDADETDISTDSDLSEEVVLNTEIPSLSISDQNNPSPSSANLNLIPPVRSPKFISARQHQRKSLGRRRRSISADNIPSRKQQHHQADLNNNNCHNLQIPPISVLNGSHDNLSSALGPQSKLRPQFHLDLSPISVHDRSKSEDLVEQQRLQNRNASSSTYFGGDRFLHPSHAIQYANGSARVATSNTCPSNMTNTPLLYTTCLNSSGNSLANLTNRPGTPVSPMTPATPSSLGAASLTQAGLDRSSATRRAVKKRRRAHVKNTRPLMTQFQVPDEAQLLDDDDLDDLNELMGQNNNGDDNDSDPQQQSNMRERIVYQFHYHNWASHTCPFVSSLLHFRRRVRICMDEMSKSGKVQVGPTIVHCSDGCGRTGTYLCIDANLEKAEDEIGWMFIITLESCANPVRA